MVAKFANFVVERRRAVLTTMLIITALVSVFIFGVHVNSDLTKYLPEDSSMKEGLAIMEEELPDVSTIATLRVMVSDVSDEERTSLVSQLGELDNVTTVTYKASDPDYNQDNRAMYLVYMSCAYQSSEERQLQADIENLVAELYPQASVVSADDNPASSEIPLETLVIALGLLFLVLVAMCPSWLESLLFLVAIACAVGINLGSNIIMGEISSITMCIAALLQLVLSMDYSIILMNRYRQELELESIAEGQDRPDAQSRQAAMKRAICGAFVSITSSSLTTFVGLLALVFMSFTIGADLGIVLAKGVICSLICVLTILPALILYCDQGIRKSVKPTLHPERAVGRIATFSARVRWGVVGMFVVVFVLVAIGQTYSDIAYTLERDDEIAEIFPRSTTVVLLYENGDEDTVSARIDGLEENELVSDVSAWGNTLGKQYSADELLDAFADYDTGEASDVGLDAEMIDIVYYLYHSGKDIDSMSTIELVRLKAGSFELDPSWTMSIEELVDYMQNVLMVSERFAEEISDDQQDVVDDMVEQVEDGAAMIRGANHSIMSITLQSTAGSDETLAFLTEFDEWCAQNLAGEFHLIGDSAMAYEMSADFNGEYLFISLLTAIAIFIVVAVSFRNVLIPLVLVLIVQCGVFLTVVVQGLQGYSIYYLALIIVQCILMGATIDYGILFTNNYRDARVTMHMRDALEQAYKRSIHTILTSGLIIVLATGAVSLFGSDPTIGQICRTISIGAFCTIVLIVVFLPGILCALDRLMAGTGRLSDRLTDQ